MFGGQVLVEEFCEISFGSARKWLQEALSELVGIAGFWECGRLVNPGAELLPDFLLGSFRAKRHGCKARCLDVVQACVECAGCGLEHVRVGRAGYDFALEIGECDEVFDEGGGAHFDVCCGVDFAPEPDGVGAVFEDGA